MAGFGLLVLVLCFLVLWLLVAGCCDLGSDQMTEHENI